MSTESSPKAQAIKKILEGIIRQNKVVFLNGAGVPIDGYADTFVEFYVRKFEENGYELPSFGVLDELDFGTIQSPYQGTEEFAKMRKDIVKLFTALKS